MREEFLTHTLPNGIRLIFHRNRSDVVHCAMTVNTGSRDELPGEDGLAHMVEHTIFKGTRRRGMYHINSFLESVGGELNAYTSKEETVIQAVTLRHDFPKAVEIVADILFDSVFPDREVEKEKDVILDEMNMYRDSPQDRIFDDFEDLIYAGSSMGHNILGTSRSIRRMSSDSVRRFVARTYNTDQMVFSVIGNITPDRFLKVTERFLGPVPSNPRGFERPTPVLPPRFEKAAGHSTHQLLCVMGSRTFSLQDDRRLPLLLLSNMLAGPAANSILNLQMRERKALTYAVESLYTPMTDSGLFTIFFSSDKDRKEECMEVIRQELDRLCSEPLSQWRLSRTKKQFWGQMLISMENNESYMLSAGRSYMLFGSVDSADEIREQIMQVSASDMMDAAQRTFADMSTLIFQ